MKQLKALLVVISMIGFASESRSDQFHYHNVIIGDRALGLGGAYAGISDDASGIAYNPAGLAFALSNDVSGSANAFYSRRVIYKNAIEDQDFKEYSSGMMAPFFGTLNKLDHIIPGMAMAGGIYTTDTELKDQNDKIQTPVIKGFHRTANVRASSTYFSLATAKRFRPNLAFGVGLSYLSIDELTQEYQDVETLAKAGEDPFFRVLTQNIRQSLVASAIEPIIGVQWAPVNRLSVGLAVRVPIAIAQKLETDYERTTNFVRSDYSVVTDDPEGRYGGGKVRKEDFEKTEKNPLGNLPWQARFGTAWFASTRLVWATDVIYTSEAKGDDPAFDREAVINVATGAEYYVTPAVPVRAGLFTNFDSRPELEEGKVNQRDHIDYTGMSLFFAWVQPTNQVSAGVVYQYGIGKAQKLSDDTKLNEVEAHAVVGAISVTHNF